MFIGVFTIVWRVCRSLNWLGDFLGMDLLDPSLLKSLAAGTPRVRIQGLGSYIPKLLSL